MAMAQEYVNTLKLLVIGDSGVGKSSIVTSYVDGFFSDIHISTIGIDFRIKKINVNDKSIMLQIWDVAGQEKFRSIAPIYFRHCDGIIILFDVTNQKSFDNIKKWITEIDKYNYTDTVKILVGNKCDLKQKRVVNIDDVRKFIDEMDMTYIETSAKKGKGINNVFETLVTKLIKNLGNNNTLIDESIVLDSKIYLDDNCDC